MWEAAFWTVVTIVVTREAFLAWSIFQSLTRFGVIETQSL